MSLKPILTTSRRCLSIQAPSIIPARTLYRPISASWSVNSSSPTATTSSFAFPRSYHAKKSNVPSSKPQNKQLRNEQIRSSEIKFVDADGKFQGVQSLRSVLDSFDRNIYHLVCMTPSTTETGGKPLCKLFSKVELEEKERSTYLSSREKKASKALRNPATVIKEIEMSWAIAPNDLRHRLRKVEEFLQKGNKVRIMLATKKGMAKQTLERMKELIEQIREEAEKNGREGAEPEGNIGMQYTLFYDGIKKDMAATTSPTAESAQSKIEPERSTMHPTHNTIETGQSAT